MTLDLPRPADPVRRRRRLRLQGAARRAGAGAGRALPGGRAGDDLLVGLENGDDARRRPDRRATGRWSLTADFFTPVVDDLYDWGRIAAANALSDVYAMGGEPLVAVNLLAWPRDGAAVRPGRRGAARRRRRGARGRLPPRRRAQHRRPRAEVRPGRHRPRRPGAAAAQRRRRRRRTPLTLTKPLGLGVLNNRHKATGEVFPEAVATMTALNRDASRAAAGRGAICATDVTGFGLLGHLLKLCRASGVDAVLDAAAVPYLDGARESLAAGFVPGGSRRNLDWVRPHVDARVDEDELAAAGRRPDLGRAAGRRRAARSPGDRPARPL